MSSIRTLTKLIRSAVSIFAAVIASLIVPIILLFIVFSGDASPDEGDGYVRSAIGFMYFFPTLAKALVVIHLLIFILASRFRSKQRQRTLFLTTLVLSLTIGVLVRLLYGELTIGEAEINGLLVASLTAIMLAFGVFPMYFINAWHRPQKDKTIH